MICTFCYNKGIPAPHNHTVRHWTMPNRPIICPQLLATKCINCNLMGHTVLYCPTKNNKKEVESLHQCEDNTPKYQKNNEDFKNNKKREVGLLQQYEDNTPKYQKYQSN